MDTYHGHRSSSKNDTMDKDTANSHANRLDSHETEPCDPPRKSRP